MTVNFSLLPGFFSGHSGIQGNETAETLVCEAAITGHLNLDPLAVMEQVKTSPVSKQPDVANFTLNLLLDKNVKPGEGRRCDLCGATRRKPNQLVM